MIRVLLADDEAMIRAGVRAILASAPEIEVAAEASDGRAAVDLARKHRPDVVLLDIRMPQLDGLDALTELRRLLPETAVVMLTTFGEDEYIARALAGGASGFLLKASDPRELVAACRAVADGAAYLSPKIAHRVITHLSSSTTLGKQQTAQQRVAVLTIANATCSRCSGGGCRTPRSPNSSTSWRERSRAMSAPCCPAWRPRTASRRRSWPTRRGSSILPEAMSRRRGD